MPTHPAVQALLALTALTCAFALWKGGLPERIATAIVILNIGAGFVGDQIIPGYLGMARLTVDAVTAFGFLALTLRYGLPWLGVAMLLFSLQFGLHAFYLVTERSPREVLHAIINNAIFFWVICCLMFGTIGAIRRRRAAQAA